MTRSEIVPTIVSVTGKIAGASGLLTVITSWLQVNATWIGALVAILSLVIHLFFRVIEYVKSRQADKNKNDILYLKEKSKTTDARLENIDRGIASILVKIDKE